MCLPKRREKAKKGEDLRSEGRKCKTREKQRDFGDDSKGKLSMTDVQQNYRTNPDQNTRIDSCNIAV